MFSKSIITESLSKLNENFENYLSMEELESYCTKEGIKWRERILTPGRTIQLFLLQILNKNTACSHLRHFSNVSFSTMAYCKARARIPLKVFEFLFSSIANNSFSKEEKYLGHRIFLEDGTGCSMPDTKSLREHFGQPGGQKKDCGFPVAKLLVLASASTGMIKKILISPLAVHDMTRAVELHPELQQDDIIVGDRGFCSYAHFALLTKRGLHAVFRLSASLKADFRSALREVNTERVFVRGMRIKKLGKADQLLYWQKTSYKPKWLNKEQFHSLVDVILLRELRYKLNRKGFRCSEITLVTTLIDPDKYPKAEIAKLYGIRWDIETNIRHLKITLGMDVLRCKTVNGVSKELFAFCIVYNLIRAIVLKAAIKCKIDAAQISFIDAMRWLQQHCSTPLENLIINPIRTGRASPRIVKRRPKNYPRMTKQRNTFPGFNLAEQAVTA
jgi:hypothetical protein